MLAWYRSALYSVVCRVRDEKPLKSLLFVFLCTRVFSVAPDMLLQCADLALFLSSPLLHLGTISVKVPLSCVFTSLQPLAHGTLFLEFLSLHRSAAARHVPQPLVTTVRHAAGAALTLPSLSVNAPLVTLGQTRCDHT